MLDMAFGDQALSWSSFSSYPGQKPYLGTGGIASLAIASGCQELREMPHCKEAARLRSAHLWHAHSGGMLRDKRLQSSRPSGTEGFHCRPAKRSKSQTCRKGGKCVTPWQTGSRLAH